jgi:hypothetical protein
MKSSPPAVATAFARTANRSRRRTRRHRRAIACSAAGPSERGNFGIDAGGASCDSRGIIPGMGTTILSGAGAGSCALVRRGAVRRSFPKAVTKCRSSLGAWQRKKSSSGCTRRCWSCERNKRSRAQEKPRPANHGRGRRTRRAHVPHDLYRPPRKYDFSVRGWFTTRWPRAVTITSFFVANLPRIHSLPRAARPA